jgi:hypothetical protein
MTIATIESGARALAEATVQAERAVEALTAATAAQAQIRNRIAACEAARQDIVRRRRTVAADDDGARLALLSADESTLREILGEHDAAVTAAKAVADQAQQAVARADQMLTIGRDAEIIRRLVQYCGELDEAMQSALAELATITKRVGGRPRWAPSPALVNELQRLHLVGIQVRR